MEKCPEMESIKTILSEVDNTADRITYSTQCIKAQDYLTQELRKRAEQQKERCSYIFATNMQLQSVIQHVKQEIASLLMAQDTIKKGNVEFGKELLLAREKKLEILDRIEKGEKKYEDLWLESKARYESLPFVQKLLKAREEVENTKRQITELEDEEKAIDTKMKAKREACRETDRKRIIELAEYMVVERPRTIKLIKEKYVAIKAISDKLNAVQPEKNNKKSKTGDNDDVKIETSFMPKLQLNYNDFENLNANLDEIKDDEHTKTLDKTYSVHSILVIDPSKISKKKTPYTEEYISSFFFNPAAKYEVNHTRNYAKKKLINILGDMKIDRNEAQKMIADVDPNVLQPVASISVIEHQEIEKNNRDIITKGNGNVKIVECEEIEEINMSASEAEVIVKPPTQFLDYMTPEVQDIAPDKSMEEESSKKKVKFDLPRDMEAMDVDDQNGNGGELNANGMKHDNGGETDGNETKHDKGGEIDANETEQRQLDASGAEDGIAKIKDMIMKKNYLDLSPQFVYSKNVMAPLNSKKAENTVTSKFFSQEQNEKNTEVQNTEVEQNQDTTAKEVSATMMEVDEGLANVKLFAQEEILLGVSDSKKQKMNELTEADKPISGFMCGTSTQMTCDVLDDTNTTLFGDGDNTSCFDSSLLQSPTADLSVANIDSQESLVDVPNFLSGLRKTGFSSIFGQFSSEAKPDLSAQKQNQGGSGFNFNFGGEEKKSRGGLFSMFK